MSAKLNKNFEPGFIQCFQLFSVLEMYANYQAFHYIMHNLKHTKSSYIWTIKTFPLRPRLHALYLVQLQLKPL